MSQNMCFVLMILTWNECLSNHWQIHCVLNSSSGLTFCITVPFEGTLTVTSGFPSQRGNNVKNVSVSWYHGNKKSSVFMVLLGGKLVTWWRHQMETFSTLLAVCAGNSPVTGEFPSQGTVTRSFDAFLDLCLNKCLSKQSWGWWFEMPSRSLWHHCDDEWLLCTVSL